MHVPRTDQLQHGAAQLSAANANDARRADWRRAMEELTLAHGGSKAELTPLAAGRRPLRSALAAPGTARCARQVGEDGASGTTCARPGSPPGTTGSGKLRQPGRLRFSTGNFYGYEPAAPCRVGRTVVALKRVSTRRRDRSRATRRTDTRRPVEVVARVSTGRMGLELHSCHAAGPTGNAGT